MTAMPQPTATERCAAQPFCHCGRGCPVPVHAAVGYSRAIIGDVLDRLPAGPERDRLSDALDVLQRAGGRGVVAQGVAVTPQASASGVYPHQVPGGIQPLTELGGVVGP